MVFRLHAVNAQTSHARRPAGVAGNNHAAVAEAAEIFGRVEAETGHTAEAAGALALILGAERLGGVLYDDEIVPLGDVPQTFHVGALAKQVNRHDGAGARRDLAF